MQHEVSNMKESEKTNAKTRTRFSKKSPLGATRQNQQILAFAYNNKRVRATATFGMLVVCVESIDYAYL